jgi:hypothetical protein
LVFESNRFFVVGMVNDTNAAGLPGSLALKDGEVWFLKVTVFLWWGWLMTPMVLAYQALGHSETPKFGFESKHFFCGGDVRWFLSMQLARDSL